MQVNLITLNNNYLDKWQVTPVQKAVMADLEVEPLIDAMAQDDRLIANISTRLFFEPVMTNEALKWRQATVRNALASPAYFEWLYQFTSETLQKLKHNFWEIGSESASYHVYNKSRLLREYLKAIATILAKPIPKDAAPAVSQWYQNLDEAFRTRLDKMTAFTKKTLLDNGYVLPANLATDLEPNIEEIIDVVPHGQFQKLFTRMNRHAEGFEIAERDDNSTRALANYKDHAVFPLATILVNAYQEIDDWFNELNLETGWLVGVINLDQQLPTEPRCYATLRPTMALSRLSNPLVPLLLKQAAVGNEFQPGKTPLTVITGANQGGKTTFLRALGLAQLMAQAGMFVFAEKCQTKPFDMVLTHFKREEDQHEQHGKLDDELNRMNGLVKVMSRQTLLLMNESFASTNEHEGSQINWQITKGLLDMGITVITVSHQYEYTQLLTASHYTPYFLLAQRKVDGQRSYHMLPATPKVTSYGLDIYHRVIDQS